MAWINFYDIQNKTEYIMQINPEHYIRPYVGDYIINLGYKYKVVEVCIDYDNDGKCDVFLEKIDRIEPMFKLKPKCYIEFNPKDIGKKGKKGCLGDLDLTSGNDSPILGELKPFDIEEKCKKCKWLIGE